MIFSAEKNSPNISSSNTKLLLMVNINIVIIFSTIKSPMIIPPSLPNDEATVN